MCMGVQQTLRARMLTTAVIRSHACKVCSFAAWLWGLRQRQ